MKTKSFPWLAILCSLLSLVSAGAQEDLPSVKPEVKTLAAFKNGLGFVFKAGDTRLKDGWARTESLPDAALGSLWIGTTAKGAYVSDIISYKERVAETNQAATLTDLLEANVGHRIAVSYAIGNTQLHAEGVLVTGPVPPKLDELSFTTTTPDVYGAIRPASVGQPSDLIVIRTGTGGQSPLLALNRNSIQSVELLDSQVLSNKTESLRPRAKFHVTGNPASAEITMAYLEKGIVWSPSYRINIADDKNAEIALDAVLANDVEDLTNAEVSFVVGFPNFLYSDMQSPLSLRQSVASFVQSLMSGSRTEPNYRFANGNIMSQSAIYNVAAYDSSRSGGTYSSGQPLPGEGNEDLYLYKKTGVTLKKGDRARYEVFNASVPYEHVYQWEVADDQNLDDRGFRRSPNNNQQSAVENQVWHVLRLENKTKQPWTTAPAFTMNGSAPVAQDVLGYTPAGGKSTLKLTVATDLRAEASQTEQQRRSISSEGFPADEVTVNGKLKVTSFKTGELSVVVRKSLVGEVLDAGNGKITKTARAINAINPNSQIEWEFKLPAGKDQELTYQYKVIVRR